MDWRGGGGGLLGVGSGAPEGRGLLMKTRVLMAEERKPRQMSGEMIQGRGQHDNGRGLGQRPGGAPTSQ